jgi:hypothetical protein
LPGEIQRVGYVGGIDNDAAGWDMAAATAEIRPGIE